MELEATINESNTLYVPVEIKKLLGIEITLFTGGSCILLAPAKSNDKTILESIDILKKEIQLRSKIINNNADLLKY